ncbi:hypothetical protein G3I59_05570 [Amycolatopsis rubida]|uniref:Uncharacterized protein n=1 Tax=Amycolatopsis rubida TaxID=112413 RepID=A0A1I5J8E8_9PSEU|nr:hypothetical protein [Amycolatopsis rubida]NEC55078.1 hypothetical protein [Amycolatopsis rubida]SFO68863.1 hypothetical protein SAMN05421854_102987 [Amycolatopsis rubida]
MTRPPVPLTAAQQHELVQQIGQAGAAALPAGWQQLQVVCRAAGRHVEVDVAVLAPDNRTYPVQPHPELPRLFGVLRTGMYQPGRGTWLTATLVFSPQRPPFADYQPDVEPRWRQPPPPIGFQDELRFFPREDRFVPPWLRQRAGAATPGAAPGQPVPPPVPSASPAVPPPLPGTENPPAAPPEQAAEHSVPALPVDETSSPPPATAPPMPGLEQAASVSAGDEAQSGPSEIAATAPETSEPEGGAPAEQEKVPAEAPPTGPEAVASEEDSASPAVELRTPRVYDGFDEAGNPVVEREALSAEERERVLGYLDSAPVILASRSKDTDVFDPSRTDAVPLNFRTDGSWVWPGAVAYYLREHGISPDPELVGHIRAAGFAVPEVDEATQERMLAALTSMPAEESRPSQAEPPKDPEQLVSEISTALIAAAPQGWQQIVFDFMTLGRHANLACGARMADGSTHQVPVARELSRPLAELRRAKYVQGRGTWYALSLVIEPPSTYQARFNEDDEPAFHTPPRPEDYALDQELYPREEDYLPLWFSARLPESPQ